MSSYNKTQMRIVQDYYDFNKNKPDKIYFYLNKKNIYKCYALIVGVKGTPYFGGFYLFQIDFSENYPDTSPKVKMLSVNGVIRLNPNLYECGKVCFSILGTWPGPSWTKVMTVRTILISIHLYSTYSNVKHRSQQFLSLSRASHSHHRLRRAEPSR